MKQARQAIIGIRSEHLDMSIAVCSEIQQKNVILKPQKKKKTTGNQYLTYLLWILVVFAHFVSLSKLEHARSETIPI
jgi:hypothetical protein